MITITSEAEQKIRELMQQDNEAAGLRIYVRGGGCHGYQYGMAFEPKIAEDDTVIARALRSAYSACRVKFNSQISL